jgi:hypothetical protein
MHGWYGMHGQSGSHHPTQSQHQMMSGLSPFGGKGCPAGFAGFHHRGKPGWVSGYGRVDPSPPGGQHWQGQQWNGPPAKGLPPMAWAAEPSWSYTTAQQVMAYRPPQKGVVCKGLSSGKGNKGKSGKTVVPPPPMVPGPVPSREAVGKSVGARAVERLPLSQAKRKSLESTISFMVSDAIPKRTSTAALASTLEEVRQPTSAPSVVLYPTGSLSSVLSSLSTETLVASPGHAVAAALAAADVEVRSLDILLSCDS